MIPDHILFPATGVRFQYPFATMAVGEYFLVTIQEVAKSAYNSARHHSKVNPGKKFAKLRVDQGWRIVRIA
jgi:hypothetical protein